MECQSDRRENKKLKIKKILVVLLSLLLLFVTACSNGGDSKDTGKENSLEKVTVILDYLPNTNHTGLYAALEKGYYREQGLDVSIIQPSEGATGTLIAAGKGDFGVSYQEDVTYARTAADPLPIRAIAAVLQHNTSGFMSYKEKNITSPKDFEGKTYAGWGSPGEEKVIKAVMKNIGADFSKVKMISLDGQDFFALAKTTLDFTWEYYAWAGIKAKTMNFPVNFIPVTEFEEALDFYTPVLIASEATIKEKPELVKKFMVATEKGYDFAIKHSDDAAAILGKYAPEYDLQFLKESQKWIADKYTDDAPRWGVMDERRWDAYTKFMMDNKLIDKNMDAKEAFTNEFLSE